MIREIISEVALKYLPNELFSLLLTTFWSRDTQIEKREEGWMIRRGGLELLSPTPKCLFMRLNEWEEKFERFFKLEQGETAVDVGACYGDTAVPMAIKVGSTGKVVAIEASPINAHFLRLNLQKFSNCDVIEKAMWNQQQDSISFWLHAAPTGGSIEHAYERNKEIKVSTDTLDNVLANTKVDFLKIDVQGVEVEVIKGASETLSRVPKFIVETHYRNSPARTYPQVMEMLKQFGHKLHYSMDNGCVYAVRT